jgi:DNA-binding SARP family transcriptional activator
MREQTMVDAVSRHLQLRLLGRFRLTGGATVVDVPEGTQRLLALLALRGRARRHEVAAMLWPGVEERTYLARLRTAIWRLPNDVEVVSVTGQWLGLGAAVRTDVDRLTRAAGRITAGAGGVPDCGALLADQLAGELLPGWYDDWVLLERERLRVLQLDALERASATMLRAGRCGQALEAGLRAVWADPLRESARRCVIATYLAEDNLVEAVLHYNSYVELLMEELGVGPSAELRVLVHRAVAARGRHCSGQQAVQLRTRSHSQHAV